MATTDGIKVRTRLGKRFSKEEGSAPMSCQRSWDMIWLGKGNGVGGLGKKNWQGRGQCACQGSWGMSWKIIWD